jgi:AcrR family transcriptional regulator
VAYKNSATGQSLRESVIVTVTRDKVGTLDKILKAAEGEFSSKGFEAANVETIAKIAGVTKQLVHHYFRTKEQLYRATLDNVAENMVQLLEESATFSDLPPRDGIRSLINQIINDYIQHPGYAALTLDQSLHQCEHVSPASRFIPSMRAKIENVLKPILEKGIAEGVFRADLDVDMTFWIIFYSANACFLHGKVMSEASEKDFSDPKLIEMWRNTSIEFILASLAA